VSLAMATASASSLNGISEITEREAVKRIAKGLLETLKGEKLVLD
jgi:hypothetical protein